MSRSITLVRHTEVARRWRGRCYGSSDPGLSREGKRAAQDLARKLGAKSIDVVIHSGLDRARYLAEQTAAVAGVTPRIDRRWQERDFRRWETRTWLSIWRESGNAMDGMLSRPRSYRPGEGETTQELKSRVIKAWNALPRQGNIVVITHGGPIAIIRAHLERRPLRIMLRDKVPTGGFLRFSSDYSSPGRRLRKSR